MALRPVFAGSTLRVGHETLTVEDEVPAGHQVALAGLMQGEQVIKYGFPIGHLTAPVPRGTHVHTHNMVTSLGDVVEYEHEPDGREGLVLLESLGNDGVSVTAEVASGATLVLFTTGRGTPSVSPFLSRSRPTQTSQKRSRTGLTSMQVRC